MKRLAGVLVYVAFAIAPALAQIPDAPHCSVDQPPPDAGAYGTPGGFLLVHPRNAALSDGYSGCKTLWVVHAPERIHRLMTLYFERGKLRVARIYDGRGAPEPRATCSLPGPASGCDGVESNPLTALRLPTWPRICMTRPEAPPCAKEPH